MAHLMPWPRDTDDVSQGDDLLRPPPLHDVSKGIGSGDEEPLGFQVWKIKFVLRLSITQRVDRIGRALAINVDSGDIEAVIRGGSKHRH